MKFALLDRFTGFELLWDVCLSVCFYLYIQKELAPRVHDYAVASQAAGLKWLVPGVMSVALELLYYASSTNGSIAGVTQSFRMFVLWLIWSSGSG